MVGGHMKEIAIFSNKFPDLEQMTIILVFTIILIILLYDYHIIVILIHLPEIFTCQVSHQLALWVFI